MTTGGVTCELRDHAARRAGALLAGRRELSAPAFAQLSAQCPSLPLLCALADADTTVTGQLTVRAYLAEHWPLAELLSLLRNPAAAYEIAQHQVTAGADHRWAADPERGGLLSDLAGDGLPLSLTALERLWRTQRSAWFSTQPVPLTDLCPTPAATPASLSSSSFHGLDPFTDDDLTDPVLSSLLALPGSSWLSTISGRRGPGDLHQAAASLAHRTGLTGGLRLDDGDRVLGELLSWLRHTMGTCPLELRTAAAGVLTGLHVSPDPADVRTLRWAHLRLGNGPYRGLALSDPASGQSWAAAFRC